MRTDHLSLRPSVRGRLCPAGTRALAALAAVSLLVVAAPDADAQGRRAQPEDVYAVPVGDSVAMGPADAKVTLVFASEFASPFCRRIWDTFKQLRQEYKNDLRIVHKHMIVHPQTARAPALAACAAGRQGKFVQMADAIWAKAYDSRKFDADHMTTLARGVGLNMRKYQRDVAGACQQIVSAEDAQMKKFGVRGVPGSFVNGRFLSGARPVENFRRVIDEELAKANERLARGGKARAYYKTHILGKGLAEAPVEPPRKVRPPIGGGGEGAARPGPPRPRGPDPALVYAAPVGDSPFRGPRHAKVTMVIACQFGGPYCNKLRPVLAQLEKDYGRDLKIVFKHFIVHASRATEPALAACAAHRQGKYNEMDALLWGEVYETRTFDRKTMEGLARQIGLDVKRYRADVEGACPGIVRAEQAEMSRIGVRGTPATFINGRFLSGARPVEQFKQLIDEELAKANKRVRRKNQVKRYYDTHVLGAGKKSLD